MEVSFSSLVMSIASSAMMSMGLAAHPQSGQVEKNPDIAKFNIDLLLMLKQKTAGNLSEEEDKFLNSVICDLQMKFVQSKT